MILLLFLFLTTPLTCLDSENNQPTYKFAIVTGAVDVANATTTIPNVESEDACVDKCETNANCVLAFVSSSLTCYLFDYGSITAVSKNGTNGTGETGTVAFKVYTNQPACDLNLQFLLNGKNYPLNANDTTKDLWKIDTSELGWTISYGTPPPLICGNFTYNRPYPDGCNPECDVTMVQVNAIPGPLSADDIKQDAENWNDCMYACHANLACFATYFDSTVGCRWWNIYKIWFFNRTEAQDMQGAHMAIKIPLSPVSCKYTTEQLLDDKYYLPYNRILASVKRGFFRMRTTPKYYKFSAYVDEKFNYGFHYTGCEFGTVPSATYTNGVANYDELMCVSLVNTPNITQVAANELCHEMDGKLMTERHAGFISDEGQCLSSFGRIVLNVPMYPNYGTKLGFNYQNPRGYKIWFGLEKDKSTHSFKWQAPEWSIVNGQTYQMCSAAMPKQTYVNETLNKIQFTWGPGEPVMVDGMDCGYMQYMYKSPYPGYSLKAARCDDVADIFACGHETQAKKGIPPFQQIADEYGRSLKTHEREAVFWQYQYYNESATS